jgi:hypothetical protein
MGALRQDGLADETVGRNITLTLTLTLTCGHSPYETSSIAAGPRQRGHSQVRVPRDSGPYFTVSDSRLLQHKGPDPRIYIPQEQGGPVIPTGTGSLFVASYDSQGYTGGIRTRVLWGIVYINNI